MKTILVSIFEGVEAKNILRTPVLQTLLQGEDVRLILVTKSDEKKAYYAKEFPDPRLTYEVVARKSLRGFDAFFSKLKFVALNTKTTRLKREMHGTKLGAVFGNLGSWVLSIKIVVNLIRSLDSLLVGGDTRYRALFDRYHPDLVFLAHLFDEPEIDLLREAKRRKVRTVGLVNSWDKATARCLVRILPDEFLVFNGTVAAELVRYQHIPKDRITAVGVPQYDMYHLPKARSREAFMEKIGANPENKLIVYAPMGSTFSASDWEMIDLIEGMRSSGDLGEGVELLVRFQPNDFFSREQIEARPWLRYDYPGIRFSATRGVDWDMNRDDLDHLVDTLSYMSVLICYASSMTVDASIFDKPVINIGFELKEGTSKSKSPTQFYRMEHYENALTTGGIKMVCSKDELKAAIRTYLENPNLDREGRARLVRQQCEFSDGQSGKRIGELLLSRVSRQTA